MSAPKTNKKHTALIGIGSNINPEKNLQKAISFLAQEVDICSCSQVWQNPAVGSDGPDYLNAAITIHSDYGLEELKTKLLLPLEARLDRVRTENKNADRTIDLDILIFDGTSLDHELWTQAHVSIPSAELMPNFRHPQSGERLKEAAKRLKPDDKFWLRDDLKLHECFDGSSPNA